MERLRSERRNNLLLREKATAGLAALLAASALAGAETGKADANGAVENPTIRPDPQKPIKRMANRLERRINLGKVVRVDADHDAYWSHSKRITRPTFDFKTVSPVVARYKGNERYFRITQRGDSLRHLQVYPIPSRGLALAENNNSRTFNCDISPDETVNLELNKRNQPVAQLEYGPEALRDTRYALVGKTTIYSRAGVLTPAVTPGNHGCAPSQ